MEKHSCDHKKVVSAKRMEDFTYCRRIGSWSVCGCLAVMVSSIILACRPVLTMGINQSLGLSLQAEFLITVNDTWDSNGCLTTVKTPPLISGIMYNQSNSISVGSCDSGPMRFEIKKNDHPTSYVIILTFFSSVIMDASPPTCSIPWNGTYLTPTSDSPSESLLPGCFVMDSREGYHMTYYWFHLLSWQFLHQ